MAYQSNTKHIIKNVFIMYGRMLFLMAISLYTVRVTLKILGVEDYGIYNVVAGLVTTMTFVSSSLQSAMQRFFAFSIGENDSEKQNRILNLGLIIYAGFSVLFLILGETVGLWFLNTQLVIPAERMYAASWIYQLSLILFVVVIMAIPFSSMIIAHENMSVYAVATIIYSVLLLIIVLLLPFATADKLIIYGAMMLIITIFRESFYFIYCQRKYKECYFRFTWDFDLFKSLFSYSGWTIFGTFANVTNNQGNNILINIFFGPVVNAARAIAFQVCNAIAVFSNNFFIVVTPPIVKNYSSGNKDFVKRFFFIGCKFSYFLLFMLFIPLILETPWILGVWLRNVGEYMVIFTRLALIYAIILSQHNPITAIIQATGKVKEYFVIVESFTLLTLPLTYLFFKLGYSPEYTFYITIIMFLIAHIMRLLILQKVSYISIKEYFFQFVISAIIVTVFSAVLPIFVHYYFAPGAVRFLLVTISSLISVGGFALFAGFNKQERSRLYVLVIDKLKNRT